MKIAFAGSGEFEAQTLAALLEAGHEIVQVISQPDRPAGRGRHLTPTPISKLALERELPLLRSADLNQEKLVPVDLLVVIAFGQKIAPHIVDHPRLGSINLHGSRLPKFRGAAPINAAILAGETSSGNSIIRLAQRMDAGAILEQSELAIGELETAGELHDRLAIDGGPLMVQTVERLQQGRCSEVGQDENLASRAPKLSRKSAHLDWNQSAALIARQIRGLYPWPGCHVRILEGGCERSRATLVRARAAEGSGPHGEVIGTGQVATADGLVEVVEIQPEGKRPMSLVAFRNGHPWHAGMRIESAV